MVEQHCVILNWNACGLNNPARRQVVKDMVRETRATVVALQEIKLEAIDSGLVFDILGGDFIDNFVVLPSAGLSGGILLAVSGEHYSITASEVGMHTVSATISASAGRVSWSITAVPTR
jgi:hypothetical protein